ncbi:ANTAR domain-containing response regulator [Bailinhaonella thermotolerans]|uniref:ANTAR domain-containing protein n=1 Tax=Bailinhaonella thermotolerans TaxID=1070861 RepID=A0A3A4A5L2_9ACTN|nr:ANTAR domain-containing protein [Bailinhaonella thermotolerans]RJL24146.1 ANTAR domain-containing protein [Bailinhaonella thermotolerans]
MITDELAIEIARLASLNEASQTGALNRMTDLAVRTVSGCRGAAVTLWAGSEPVLVATSHPELARIAENQHATGEGPEFDALNQGDPVLAEDLMREDRWPAFTVDALRCGLRCLATAAHREASVLLTITLYGVRPRVLTPDRLPFAALLAAQGGAAMVNAGRYDSAQRTASQLQAAVETRPIVDQAKGILMHALGCDEAAAFAELQRVSQTHHIKLTEVARRLVEEHTRAER